MINLNLSKIKCEIKEKFPDLNINIIPNEILYYIKLEMEKTRKNPLTLVFGGSCGNQKVTLY